MVKKVEDNEGILLRLRKIRMSLGLTQQDMAEKLHLRRSSYSSVEQGHNNLTGRHIDILTEKLGVSKRYLFYGEGEMLNAVNNAPVKNHVQDEVAAYGEATMRLQARIRELEEEITMYKGIIRKILKE
jgi:transcriptional regulator with XRE-family HTH domain